MAIGITLAATPEDLAAVEALFREYARSLAVNLDYQGFEAEVTGLPGAYAPPEGRLLVAKADTSYAGCVAMRRRGEASAEMKRLYVRPEFKGRGLGRTLADAVIHAARTIGYRTLLLDTLPTMTGAIHLYESLGFVRRSAYFETPIEGNVFMELGL